MIRGLKSRVQGLALRGFSFRVESKEFKTLAVMLNSACDRESACSTRFPARKPWVDTHPGHARSSRFGALGFRALRFTALGLQGLQELQGGSRGFKGGSGLHGASGGLYVALGLCSLSAQGFKALGFQGWASEAIRV